MDLNSGERDVKVTEGGGPLRIEVVKVETPIGAPNTPHQIVIEGMENGSFLIMVMQFTTIMLNNLNFVPTATLVCTSMEVAGIFVTFNGCPNLTALLPESQLGLGNSTQKIDNYGAKSGFRSR